MFWLLERIMGGKTLATIAKEAGRDRDTIQKYMRKAALAVVDAGQALFMQEVYPLALDVYKAKMLNMKKRLEAGEDVPIADIERIMKGLSIFDTPLVAHPEPTADGGGEPTDLAMLIVQRQQKPHKQEPPIIDVEAEVNDADED